jgi:hypothetical protein
MLLVLGTRVVFPWLREDAYLLLGDPTLVWAALAPSRHRGSDRSSYPVLRSDGMVWVMTQEITWSFLHINMILLTYFYLCTAFQQWWATFIVVWALEPNRWGWSQHHPVELSPDFSELQFSHMYNV